MPKDVIIACDFNSEQAVLDFLDRFPNEKPFVKIGMELYYACGPAIVEKIKNRGHKVFLDLKLHDIPNTVKKALSVLADLQVDMTNVHASGTIAMMEAAAEGYYAKNPNGILIAVTQLTSTTEERMQNDLLIDRSMEEVVAQYALNTKKAGLKGVVCSPLESPKVHVLCGNDFLTVTPGIRFADDAKGDQARVTTPAKAKELGSDYIVVGRSITAAADPYQAYRKCVNEFLK